MRLFILFVLLLMSTHIHLYGQTYPDINLLNAKEKRALKKQVREVSYQEKLGSFICLTEDNLPNQEVDLGGLVFQNLKSLKEFSSSSTKKIKKYLAYSNNMSYDDLPFPSLDGINKNDLPDWLPTIFDADYIVDLASPKASTLFYGLDSIGIYSYAKAYSSWNSLVEAIITHDILFCPMSYDSLSRVLNNVKLSSKDRKAIDTKFSYSMLINGKTKQVPPPSIDRQVVKEWIWKTTLKTIDITTLAPLVPIEHLEEINICSFSFTPEEFTTFSNEVQHYSTVPHYTMVESEEQTLKRLATYDLVIVPCSNLPDADKNFLAKLSSLTDVLVIAFDNIIDISTFDISIIKVPDNNSLSQSLAAQVIFGAWAGKSCENRLRYGSPELVGMNPKMLNIIDSIIEEALAEEAIPGCQVLVARDGMVVFNKNYGYQAYDSAANVKGTTLYDLASITKVLATTQGIMKLVEDGLLELDAPLSSYLPYLQTTNKKDITIRQVMAHQAGLYPYYPFWKKFKEEAISEPALKKKEVQVGKSLWVAESVGDSILSWAAKSDLLAQRIDTITHEQYFYSDIGFYFLKDLIERETDMSLDQYLSNNLYKPLGTSFAFNPLCNYSVEQIAPTELDNQLRNELVQGFVHDRNAALLGGVSGQAGLFGTANDVAILLQMQLNSGCYGGKEYFKPETIKQFISKQYVNNRRGLGWDMPGNEADGPVSELASAETFGHTGFTGGSIWVDPKESLIFVFLSNRVNPSGTNTKLIDLNIRTRVQDIVYKSIIK